MRIPGSSYGHPLLDEPKRDQSRFNHRSFPVIQAKFIAASGVALRNWSFLSRIIRVLYNG